MAWPGTALEYHVTGYFTLPSTRVVPIGMEAFITCVR